MMTSPVSVGGGVVVSMVGGDNIAVGDDKSVAANDEPCRICFVATVG